jgi:Spy/CpxP family protein refolding chaperone
MIQQGAWFEMKGGDNHHGRNGAESSWNCVPGFELTDEQWLRVKDTRHEEMTESAKKDS